MIYVVIILVFIGVLAFIPMSAGINDAKAKESANLDAREFEKLPKAQQEKLYQQQVEVSARIAEKNGKPEIAEKIRSGKFNYQNLKYVEYRYPKK